MPRRAGGRKRPDVGAQRTGPGERSLATVARSPKAPQGVHPLGGVLRVLGALGAPLQHEEGGPREQGQEQRREQRLHLRPPAALQQQLLDGPGGLWVGHGASSASTRGSRPRGTSAHSPCDWLAPETRAPGGQISVSQEDPGNLPERHGHKAPVTAVAAHRLTTLEKEGRRGPWGPPEPTRGGARAVPSACEARPPGRPSHPPHPGLGTPGWSAER